MRRLASAAVLTAVALLAPACTSKTPSSDVSGTVAPPPRTGKSVTDTAAPSPARVYTGTVDLVAREFWFEPSEITVTAGPTTFKIKNQGQVEHEFEIFSGSDAVDEVEHITPGITRELKVNLRPGAYTFVCKMPGHEESGMKGTLVVI